MIEKRKLQQLNGRETTRNKSWRGRDEPRFTTTSLWRSEQAAASRAFVNKSSAISKARVTAMKRKVQSVM